MLENEWTGDSYFFFFFFLISVPTVSTKYTFWSMLPFFSPLKQDYGCLYAYILSINVWHDCPRLNLEIGDIAFLKILMTSSMHFHVHFIF